MDVVVSNCMLLGYTCRAIRGRSAGNGQLWLGSDRSATLTGLEHRCCTSHTPAHKIAWSDCRAAKLYVNF
jgi:hypothetical protein